MLVLLGAAAAVLGVIQLRFGFFRARISDLGHPFREKVQPQSRIDVAVTEEASAAYQRVLSCNTYTSEAGAVWSFRQVRDEVGEDAAQPFLAAGGPSAFAWADEVAASIRFKRFMEAYRERVEERHQQRAALHAGRDLGLESAPDKLHKYITGGSE